MADYDLAIIGGGINGAGIARDAAGRGLTVLLVEQNDLASGTSSASSKLIHGGLRYLEHGEFRLVRESLRERQILLNTAPHLVRPMRFILPAQDGLRAPLVLRIGLWLYDRLAGRQGLPPTDQLDLTHHPAGQPLRRAYRLGFEYSDCVVDDARLVVMTACDAADRGAAIRTRTRCVRAERGEEWQLVLNARGRRELATARVLVNAAGPWVDRVTEGVLRRQPKRPTRLDQGSHIVVPRLFDHDRAYLLQTKDGRVVFAIPYRGNFTLIGTTDTPFVGDLDAVTPGMADINYLCGVIADYFRDVVTPADVVWRYSGVRALYDDGTADVKAASRDYALELDERRGRAPLLTVYGGKLTTYRRLAEKALDRIGSYFAMRPAWTATAPLPGGDFAPDALDREVAVAWRRWPFLDLVHLRRLVEAYGTRIERVLGEARSRAALGPWLGGDLTGAEVDYLMKHEWAQTAEDVLWRRSKLGLVLDAAACERLAAFMAGRAARPAGPV